VHTTIPGATQSWCEGQAPGGSGADANVVWQDGECKIGCTVMTTQGSCEALDDAFKLADADAYAPCEPRQRWNADAKQCARCDAETWQWPSQHFLDQCNTCPVEASAADYKSTLENCKDEDGDGVGDGIGCKYYVPDAVAVSDDNWMQNGCHVKCLAQGRGAYDGVDQISDADHDACAAQCQTQCLSV